MSSNADIASMARALFYKEEAERKAAERAAEARLREETLRRERQEREERVRLAAEAEAIRIRAERAIADEEARRKLEERDAAIRVELDRLRGRSQNDILKDQVEELSGQVSRLTKLVETLLEKSKTQ